MNDRHRFATTITDEQNRLLRQLAIDQGAPISIVHSALLDYSLDALGSPELRARLEEGVGQYRARRAEIGRKAMNARYGKTDEEES